MAIPDDWPMWAILLVQLVIILFRSKLIEMLPAALRQRWQSGAEQELYKIKADIDYQKMITEKRLLLEEVELGGALQQTATGALRLAKLDDNLYSLLTRQMDFGENMMTSGIQEQNVTLATQYRELRAIRQTMIRLTDISAAILGCLMKSNGEQLMAISNYINGVLANLDEELKNDK